VVRTLVVVVLLIVLLVLLGMSFLRVNNLEYDVSVLREKVARLEAGGASAPPPAAAAPEAVAPWATAAPPSAAMPATAAPATPRPRATPAETTAEGLTAGFLDDGREVQVVSLPAGLRPARATVSILAVEGEGAGERALPQPITFTLSAGVPHDVPGICQGPETAAWVFVLEGANVRITSRDCEYPVRGLRPRLRITAAP
jgi:hypothetical protein